MSQEIVRIAMWSGPRNISTAMMRSFGNRADCHVWDEPYYAAYLKTTGIVHPMNAEILAAHESDPLKVEAALLGALPQGKTVFYQKHMTHHMIPAFSLDWLDRVTNAFLLRHPASVLASYVMKREDVSLDDIGFRQQAEIFDRVAERTGKVPVVVEGRDVLADPAATLSRLCGALGLAFDPAMLSWPAGRRATDGVWAPHWYHAVEASTAFGPDKADAEISALPLELARIAEAAMPYYEKLRAVKL
ncbi:sulfotransferase [Oryzibacter oryziterrae]|uniref:sulfotransferase n=1 Tax=Oryzibacter oryziterrae TaxID=2766474 RepID=UPI001F3D67E5|nr:sulfotransferase [Oryzibacter oryziterrae]